MVQRWKSGKHHVWPKPGTMRVCSAYLLGMSTKLGDWVYKSSSLQAVTARRSTKTSAGQPA
eukprot:1157920-Pelagomonas_calceolata.AAC.3